MNVPVDLPLNLTDTKLLNAEEIKLDVFSRPFLVIFRKLIEEKCDWSSRFPSKELIKKQLVGALHSCSNFSRNKEQDAKIQYDEYLIFHAFAKPRIGHVSFLHWCCIFNMKMYETMVVTFFFGPTSYKLDDYKIELI